MDTANPKALEITLGAVTADGKSNDKQFIGRFLNNIRKIPEIIRSANRR